MLDPKSDVLTTRSMRLTISAALRGLISVSSIYGTRDVCLARSCKHTASEDMLYEYLVAAGLRQVAPVLTVVDSSFETLATLLLIMVRMGNAYFGYREVQSSILHDQITERDDNVHVRLIRQWMVLFNVTGLLLLCVSLGFFLVFLYEVHLGWTLLTNNLCMITIQVLAGVYRTRVTLTPGVYRTRVTLAVTRIHEDQHKVKSVFSVLLFIVRR
jgi:hypothetical protein